MKNKWSLGVIGEEFCDLGRFRGEVFFYGFMIGEPSAGNSLQIKPRSSRGSPRNVRGEKNLAEPVPYSTANPPTLIIRVADREVRPFSVLLDVFL